MSDYTVDTLKARVAELEQTIRDIETWLVDNGGDPYTLFDFPCGDTKLGLAERSYWVIRALCWNDLTGGGENHGDGTTQDEDE